MIHPSQLTIYSLGFLAVLQSTTLSLEIEANNQPTDKTTPVDSSKSEQKTSSAEMLGGKCGGLSAVLEKDDTVGGVVDGVKGLVEEQTGLKIASIDIHSYKKQLVAGMNYFVKAILKTEEGLERIAHLRIYKNLQDKIELTAVQLDKTLDDEIVHFQ